MSLTGVYMFWAFVKLDTVDNLGAIKTLWAVGMTPVLLMSGFDLA